MYMEIPDISGWNEPDQVVGYSFQNWSRFEDCRFGGSVLSEVTPRRIRIKR